MWVFVTVLVVALLVATGTSLWIDRVHDRLREDLTSASILFEADEVRVSLAGQALMSRSVTWKKGELLVTDQAAVIFPRGPVFKQQPIVLLREANDQPGAGGLGTIRIVLTGPPEHGRTAVIGAPAVTLRGSGPASSRWTVTLQTAGLGPLMDALRSFVRGPQAEASDSIPTTEN